jgi:periplasmic divalent cation tolerance protein
MFGFPRLIFSTFPLFHSLTFFMLVVLTTTPSVEEAESLAQKIVEAKLAACVQVLPQMTSVYFWENAIQKDAEHLLLIKTLSEKFDELQEFIQSNHSYEVPEIVALPAEKVSSNYLNWMIDYLKS